MPMKDNREYRDMTLAVIDEEVAEERSVVSGYATTFEQPYRLFDNEDFAFDEIVDARAFDNTDMSDVIMQYDHQGRVFARLSNGTLEVKADERGLLINADLGGTQLGRELYEEISKGYTNKMSFGFTVSDEERSKTTLDDGRPLITRRIKSVGKLYDVSAVSIPANNATSISVRSLTDGVMSEIRAERLEAEALELKRRKMKAKAELLGGRND